MRKLPSQQDFADADALKITHRKDRVLYARHVAEHPDFASMDGQALPDSAYREAMRLHPGDSAEAQHLRTAHLQKLIHALHMRRLSEAGKPAPTFSRADAVFHTLAKSVLPSAIAVAALWELTGPVNGAVALSFASVWCGIKLIGALLTSEVF